MLAKNILQKANVMTLVSGNILITQAEELTASKAMPKRKTYYLTRKNNLVMAKFNTMKQTIKTMIIIFCFFFLFLHKEGENYKAFNRLIKQTDIESFYTINELRMLFEDPLLQESEEVLERFKRKPEKKKRIKNTKIFFYKKKNKKGLRLLWGTQKTPLKRL